MECCYKLLGGNELNCAHTSCSVSPLSLYEIIKHVVPLLLCQSYDSVYTGTTLYSERLRSLVTGYKTDDRCVSNWKCVFSFYCELAALQKSNYSSSTDLQAEIPPAEARGPDESPDSYRLPLQHSHSHQADWHWHKRTAGRWTETSRILQITGTPSHHHVRAVMYQDVQKSGFKRHNSSDDRF